MVPVTGTEKDLESWYDLPERNVPRNRAFRAGLIPARLHKTVLCHAVAKHDPNTERRHSSGLYDRMYSWKSF